METLQEDESKKNKEGLETEDKNFLEKINLFGNNKELANGKLLSDKLQILNDLGENLHEYVENMKFSKKQSLKLLRGITGINGKDSIMNLEQEILQQSK